MEVTVKRGGIWLIASPIDGRSAKEGILDHPRREAFPHRATVSSPTLSSATVSACIVSSSSVSESKQRACRTERRSL